MQRVYHSIVKDVDELRERLISVWCELDHAVCCEPRHRRTEASSVGLYRRLRRTLLANVNV